MSPEYLDRRTLAVLTLVIAMVMAGCGLLGGGESPSNETETPAGPNDGGLNNSTGPPEANQLPNTASDDRTWAETSFTLESQTRIQRADNIIRQNATLRVQQEPNRSSIQMNRTLVRENRSTMAIESYASPEGVYTRYESGAGETAVYDRTDIRETINRSGPLSSLDSQFDFDRHSTDGDDTVRYVADSADQVLEPPSEGTIENVSVVVTVEPDTGRQLAVNYHLRLTVDSQTYGYHAERQLTDIDSTSVAEPEWLPTAMNRTSS